MLERSTLLQATAITALAAGLMLIAAAVNRNMAASGLQFGFDFLSQPAGFRIGETFLPYSPSDSYGWALIVGFANTVRVALLAAAMATVAGVIVGIFRLSRNPLLRRMSACYVEVIRNTPLILQLVLWHAVILGLPPVRLALAPLPGIFLSQRGLQVPTFLPAEGFDRVLGVLIAAAAVAALNAARGARQRRLTGDAGPIGLQNTGILLVGSALALSAFGSPVLVEPPVLRGFNFVGGLTLTPEYAALLFGLIVYTSAFIGEIVRAGIQSVSAGQWEAARSLGLKESRILRLVVLPQAFRVMAPPMTNQYLNLVKNSSLAVVVGYPEFTSITNTVINQTGHAIEALTIFMGVYLALSLLTALIMNAFERRVAHRGRS